MTYTEWKRANHPIVLAAFDLADDMRSRGYKHWSMWAAINVIRWQTALRDVTQADFKISNGVIADLARDYNRAVGFAFFRTKRRKDGSA